MSELKDNLKQLYYFYETVSSKSISGAAKKLFISQPAVSMQLKKLENSCGIKLIENNTGKKLQPTPEGQKLYKYLDKIFKLLDRAETELKKMEEEKQINITIGTTPTYGRFVLPYIFEHYADLNPRFHLKVISESSISLLKSLKKNRVDIIVIALWKKLSLKSFQVHPLGYEEVILISAPDHHLQKRKNISLKSLQNETFIMRDEQSGTRKYILREFKKRGVNLPVSIECESPDLVKELIMEGKGIGFLTRTKVHKELASGLVKRVDLGNYRFYLDIAIVLDKNKELMPEMLHFVDCIVKSRREQNLFPTDTLEPCQTQPADTDNIIPLRTF
ncbi:MAG: LysR family transcriptional regulator [Deltaproteobacteria bacterium]|nr:LysR family transcriptional regulator [Deltaproteobacteria bacterium]